MRKIANAVVFLGVLGVLIVASELPSSAAAAKQDRNSIVILYKDGHQITIPMADISRIEFKTATQGAATSTANPTGTLLPSRNHFLGKWDLGYVNGERFIATLESDGTAKRSVGGVHGTWELVDGEARITWDDGWRDVIRKVGSKHQKFAHAPGRNFSDPPESVDPAVYANPRPI